MCSNPFNLDISSKILGHRFLGREVYLRAMGSKYIRVKQITNPRVSDKELGALRDLAKTHESELRKNTKIDVDAVLNKVTYLHEFDRLVQ